MKYFKEEGEIEKSEIQSLNPSYLFKKLQYNTAMNCIGISLVRASCKFGESRIQ